MDNYVLGIVGNVVSVALNFSPALYFVWKGDYERAVLIWDAASLEIGVINNMICLLYGVTTLKKDNPLEMLLTSAVGCGVNVVLLLIMYAHKREIKKVS